MIMMAKIMTFFAKRNNIEQVFWRVAFVMVILLGGVAAIYTFQGDNLCKFTGRNCHADCVFSGVLFWMILEKATHIFFALFAFYVSIFCFSTFIAMVVFSLDNLTLIALTITFLNDLELFRVGLLTTFLLFFKAYFARTMKSIFSNMIFVELQYRFDLLAMRTSFGYDLLRHNLLQYSKLSFRAGQGLQSLFGSFYCINQSPLCNIKNICSIKETI